MQRVTIKTTISSKINCKMGSKKAILLSMTLLWLNSALAENTLLTTTVANSPPKLSSVSKVQAKDEIFSIDNTRYDIPSERHSWHFTQDFSGAKIIGTGNYRYRLVLQNPLNNNKVKAKTKYALSHNSMMLPFEPTSKNVYQATTDKYGRTNVFAFEQPIDPDKWNFRERVGAGKYGEQMEMIDQNHNILSATPYVLLVCEKKPITYQGFSNNDGQTAYAASSNIVPIRLFLDLDKKDINSVKRLQKICQSD